MVNRNDNMKYTIEDICDMNYERLKPDKLMINDKLEKCMNLEYKEQEFNNFINDYYLRVHNLMKMKEKMYETSILRDFRLRCVNVLDENEKNQIDTILDNFNDKKLINLQQKLINKYNLETNYFDEIIDNFINLEDKVFDIRMLQDQFKYGNFINMYTGHKFEKDFINNILNKETFPKKYVILEEDNEEIINSVMLKFEAYVNGIITEAQSNQFSRKFFVDREDDEDDRDYEDYKEPEKVEKSGSKENVVKEEPKVIKPSVVEVGKFRTFKYNKGRKVFEEIVYNSLTELDNDTNWPKPRITKENNIK